MRVDHGTSARAEAFDTIDETVRPLAFLLVIALGSTLGTAGAVVADRVVPGSPLVRGIRIGAQTVPRGRSPASWLAERRDAAAQRIVRFRHEDRTLTTTLGDAGVEIDIAGTIGAAQAIGHQGRLVRRLRETAAARRGEIDVALAWLVDENKARTVLERLAPEVYRAPVDARLDLENRTKIPDQPGRELDMGATIARLAAGTHEDGETIEVATRPVRARVTLSDLVDVDVSKVVAAYETTFVTWGSGAGRAINIAQAAARIDGSVLHPGDELSFNERVGPRTLERGFAVAPEIQGDEMTPGVGGGTCQVSSTLHVAALYAALAIVERQAHSRPSSYTKMGLDATVSYPSVDLKIKNTLPFPILIHAYLPKPTVVRVEILGGDPVATVDYRYGIGHTEDFVRRITVKPWLEPGKRIRHQKGSRGYDVMSTARILYFDGRVEERHWFSGYRPAPEVYWVAPGYDESQLPPLPEHAKGVEGREETEAAAYEPPQADVYPM